MNNSHLTLVIPKCKLFIEKSFIEDIFTKLNLGDIESIETEIGHQKEIFSKGNKLHDTRNIYYKNIYITYNTIYEDKAIIKKMLSQVYSNSHLIVHYSKDDYWKVYKSDKRPTFKPIISFPIIINDKYINQINTHF